MRGMKSEVYAMTNACKNMNLSDLRKLSKQINYIRNDRHVGYDFQDAVPCKTGDKNKFNLTSIIRSLTSANVFNPLSQGSSGLRYHFVSIQSDLCDVVAVGGMKIELLIALIPQERLISLLQTAAQMVSRVLMQF